MTRFKIVAPHATGNMWLIEALEEQFKALDEKISIYLDDQLLLDDLPDIAIYPAGKKFDTENYEVRPLTTYEMGIYGSSLYIKQYGAPQNVDDLKKHKLISYPLESYDPYYDINWHLHLSKDDMLEPTYCVNSGYCIYQLIENGVGIGSISHTSVKYARVPLVQVLENHTMSFKSYCLVDKSEKNARLKERIYATIYERFNRF